MDCMSTLNNASFMLACFPEELVSDFNEIIIKTIIGNHHASPSAGTWEQD